MIENKDSASVSSTTLGLQLTDAGLSLPSGYDTPTSSYRYKVANSDDDWSTWSLLNATSALDLVDGAVYEVAKQGSNTKFVGKPWEVLDSSKWVTTYEYGPSKYFKVSVYYEIAIEVVDPSESGSFTFAGSTRSNGDTVKVFENSGASYDYSASSVEGYDAYVEFDGTAVPLPGSIDPRKSATLSLTYVLDTRSTISVGDAKDASVYVDGELLASLVTLDAGADVVVSAVAPEGNSYVKSIKVQYADGEYSADSDAVSFKTAATKTSYSVYVNLEDIIVLKDAVDGKRIVAYNELTSTDALTSSVFGWIDQEASATSMAVGSGLTIKYNASNYGYSWQSLDYTPSGLSALAEHAFGNGGDTESIQLKYDVQGDRYPAATLVFDVTPVDGRAESFIALNGDTVSIPYNPNYTAADIFDAVFASLKDGEGNTIEANTPHTSEEDFDDSLGTLSVRYPASLNVGSHEITVEYDGNAQYQSTDAKITVNVTKAPVDVSVESKVVKYADIKGSGVNISSLVSSDPTVDLMTFAVGLNLGDNASADAEVAAYVNVPDLMGNSTGTTIISGILKAMGLGDLQGEGVSLSASDLYGVLAGLLTELEKYEEYLVAWGVDLEGIKLLTGALEKIEQLEGVGDITVYLTMGKDVVVKDSGAYITGAVASDYNYESSIGLGYLAITPDGTKVDLAFNIEDANGLITLKNIANGSYDLGSHVVESDTVSAETAADAQQRVRDLYIGVDYEGNPVIIQGATNAQSQMTIGAYTQVSYVRDLGNEMYYAMPIVRGFAVVTDLVDVKFVDSVGENNERQFTFDGTEKLMPAKAYDRAGVELDSANITYTYLGIEGDAEGYYSTGKAGIVEGPTEVGVYTVIATYVDYAPNGEPANVGMAVGAMVIKPAEASVEVGNAYHVYDGTSVNVFGMINKTPDDAKMAVVMAGLDVSGDFSENGLSAVKGVVNVDFPTRVDNVLKQVIPSAYEDGITLSTLTGKLAEINAQLEAAGIDSEGLEELVALLEDMPNATKLTFKEQADVNPSSIGAYLVGAVIMDPNYQADADLGVLVIGPEITEAELEWNYDDSNGVITAPILNSVDLGASAYVNGIENEGYTAKIQYLFIGIDEDGNAVNTTDASALGNGVYTEIAYIVDGVSARMVYAEPIMRSIVIAPQVVSVTFVDGNGNPNNDRLFTYDGNPHEMPVVVKDMAGNVISGDALNNLVVTYIGVEGDGEGYNSTTPPSQVGAYTVIATYVERDASGELLRAGGAVGAMAIKPAQSDFDVKDAREIYDGTEKFPEIANPANLPQVVSVVVDSDNNVNVIVPDSWNVTPRVISDVDDKVAALISDLESLASVAQNDNYKAAIEKLTEVLKGIEIKSLSINGKKPVEIGAYKVHAIGFGDTNYSPVYDNGTLEIVEKPYSTIKMAAAVSGANVTVAYDGFGPAQVGTEAIELPAGKEVTVKVVANSGWLINGFSVVDSKGQVIASELNADGEAVFTTDADSVESYVINVQVKEDAGNVPGGGGDGEGGVDGDGSDDGDDPDGGKNDGAVAPSTPESGSDKDKSVLAPTGDSAGFAAALVGVIAVISALAAVIVGRRWMVNR